MRSTRRSPTASAPTIPTPRPRRSSRGIKELGAIISRVGEKPKKGMAIHLDWTGGETQVADPAASRRQADRRAGSSTARCCASGSATSRCRTTSRSRCWAADGASRLHSADLGAAGESAARRRHRDAERHALSASATRPRSTCSTAAARRASTCAGHAVIHTAPNVKENRTPAMSLFASVRRPATGWSGSRGL